MSAPLALVLTAPGTNRDRDVADALTLAGARVERIPMHLLRESKSRLSEARLLILAGGFSHADSLGSGAVWANDVRTHFADEMQNFVSNGKAILGICNGFQTLVRAGLLPGSLATNVQGSFVCRWVTLQASTVSSVWTDGISDPFDCPVAHGEGRYVADEAVVATQAALRYVDNTNPNGSTNDVAGVTDSTGRILGLMPHPENHIFAHQHPQAHRKTTVPLSTKSRASNLGIHLFAAGVRHARRV
jgi:phosphoribosylformylglycinamidine synthase subunit PurQ / glutaminase